MTILLIQNGYHGSPTAKIEQILAAQGRPYQLMKPHEGDPFPAGDEISGCISFGAAVSVYDAAVHPWLTAEKQFLQALCDRGVPVFGICLGCQLLAEVYGGRVSRGHKGMSIGFHPLDVVVADDLIFGDELVGASPYNWHGDVYTLTSGTRLAGGVDYPEKAAKFGDHVYGVQFHPELTEAMMAAWYQACAGMSLPGMIGLEAHLADMKIHQPQVDRWLAHFLRRLFQ